MRMKNWVALVLFVAVSQSAGLIGSFFTRPAIPGWYSTLVRPEVAPPSWVFAPVWTTLFLLMGIAAFLVWKSGAPIKRLALTVFGIQLVLNLLWSIVFFGLQSLGWAFVEILVLWVAIATTIYLFNRASRAAALLLIPYIAWVSFATYLTYAFWTLN